MSEDDLLPEALRALTRSFDAASETAPAPADTPGLEDVRRFLLDRITHLLDRNPSMLLHILYRVDVDERDVKRVFAGSTPEDLPGALADLLIERQLRTIRTRRRYRERNP